MLTRWQPIANPALRDRRVGDTTAQSVFKGALIGTVVGGLIGAIAFGVLLTGVDELYLAGLVGGSVWGAFLGGFGGLLTKVQWDDAQDEQRELPVEAVSGVC